MINVVVITQKDNFFIPRNIEKIIKNNSRDTNLIGVSVIESKGALNSKKIYFLKGFGITQSVKYAVLLTLQVLKDLVDNIFFYNFFNGTKSIKSICSKNNVEYLKIMNPNSKQYIEYLKSNNVDLVISFSAPIIFKENLLKAPKYGCVNLHCSMLPKYSGLMPSFWTLYKNEEFTGVSIHYMDSKIDNGKLLNQEIIEIPKHISIFNLISLTKNKGGELMCKTIKEICHENHIVKPNKQDEKYYYSWPTIKQMNEFTKNGQKFI
jgi:folate-dependent phosphoribosylglycinamide formyltransferase PurN